VFGVDGKQTLIAMGAPAAETRIARLARRPSRRNQKYQRYICPVIFAAVDDLPRWVEAWPCSALDRPPIRAAASTLRKMALAAESGARTGNAADR
jgi:hypothetical protein